MNILAALVETRDKYNNNNNLVGSITYGGITSNAIHRLWGFH